MRRTRLKMNRMPEEDWTRYELEVLRHCIRNFKRKVERNHSAIKMLTGDGRTRTAGQVRRKLQEFDTVKFLSRRRRKTSGRWHVPITPRNDDTADRLFATPVTSRRPLPPLPPPLSQEADRWCAPKLAIGHVRDETSVISPALDIFP